MGHVTELQTKITAAQEEQTKLTDELQKVKTDLGRALAEDRDSTADKLQQQRDSLVRALERCEIRLQALKAEMPSAERQDAATRLAEIQGQASALAAANTEARQKYEAALSTLLGTIDAAYSPSLRRKELQAEAEFLSEKFNLSLPALPELAQPKPADVGAVYRRCVGFFELQNNRSQWGARLSELQVSRKRAAFAARAQRERETGARVSL